jgi:hypothetical protein
MFGSVTPEQDILLHDREQLHSKACILMRVITLIGTVTLAAAILFRSPSDFMMGVFIIVSVAAPTLAVRSPLTGKFVWTRLFLRVLGVFTSFQRAQLSHFISIFEMAPLAFFAALPIILLEDPPAGGCLSTRQAIL